MPALATILKEGGKFRILSDVVRDLKKVLNKPLYDELIENSFYYAPPYLPLFRFMMESKKWPMLSLTSMEWDTEKTKAKFTDFALKNYPDHDPSELMKQVDGWLTHSKQ